MKKTYSKPEAQRAEARTNTSLLHGSWGVDGEKKPVIDGNPEGDLDAKQNKFSAWDTWDDDEEE